MGPSTLKSRGTCTHAAGGQRCRRHGCHRVGGRTGLAPCPAALPRTQTNLLPCACGCAAVASQRVLSRQPRGAGPHPAGVGHCQPAADGAAPGAQQAQGGARRTAGGAGAHSWWAYIGACRQRHGLCACRHGRACQLLHGVLGRQLRVACQPQVPSRAAVCQAKDGEAIQLRMLVHSRLCGTLIGKGGATIRSFNEDSHAVFNISPPPQLPGASTRGGVCKEQPCSLCRAATGSQEPCGQCRQGCRASRRPLPPRIPLLQA